jgi:hypothetical protein
MTREITLEEIPEMHRNTLARTAAQIIKKHGTSAYVSVPSEKQSFYYILWAGLNQEQQLEECYFLSNDFVSRNILINR